MNIINQRKIFKCINFLHFYWQNVYMFNEDNSIPSWILRRIILIIMKALCSVQIINEELTNANFKEGVGAQHFVGSCDEIKAAMIDGLYKSDILTSVSRDSPCYDVNRRFYAVVTPSTAPSSATPLSRCLVLSLWSCDGVVVFWCCDVLNQPNISWRGVHCSGVRMHQRWTSTLFRDH